MTGQIRFHLDENVDPAVADGMRRRGMDITTSQEAGLLKANDDHQLAYAVSHGRTLVTHDDDFLAVARNGAEHTGIIYCHLGTRTIGQIIAALQLIGDCMTTKEMQNHVEFI